MNPAVIYDGSIRDNGTPYYFRFALAQVLGRDPDWYSQAGEIPEGHDFYIMVDDGRDDLARVPPRPWGFYATDSHLGPEARLEKAKQADIVWCAQKPFAERLVGLGLNAKWLPLACSPAHHPTAVELSQLEDRPLAEKLYDLAFVGHLQRPDQSDRIAFLDVLRKAIPSFRFRFGVFHHEMASEYHSARIGVNHAVRDDLNMRTFELASLGVPQLCDSRMIGLKECGFEPFVHYLPYESAEQAIDVVKTYLGDSDLPTMAEAAKTLVRAEHTYEHRIRTMLADMEAL
jgi:hypothetical protein